MSTAALWLLIFTATSYRPAVVVEQFRSKEDCIAAKAAVTGLEQGRDGISPQYAVCLPVTAARDSKGGK